MNNIVVYQIKNQVNGKKYIGGTTNKEGRWRKHKSMLRNNEHHNNHLQNAYNKYGAEKFKFSVLEVVENKDDILKREQYFLDTINPEYNLADKAKAPMWGKHHTDEAKQKMSQKAQGRTHTEKAKQKMREANLGRKHSKEAKQKMSEAKQGIYQGADHPQSKLNEKKVKTIKYLLEGGQFKQYEIGNMYGVKQPIISQIATGKRWTHVSI